MAFVRESDVRSVARGPLVGGLLLLTLMYASVSESAASIVQPYLLTPTGDGRYTATAVGDAAGGIILASGLNNAGQVVGSIDPYGSPGRAFIWDQHQGLRSLGVLAGDSSSTAYGINDLGQVVGESISGSAHRAYVWDEANGMRELAGVESGADDINNTGQVTGSAGVPYRPYLWAADGGGQQIGWFRIGAGHAINSLGQVAGRGENESGQMQAFLWSASAGVSWLGVPTGAWCSTAEDLNDSAQVVGSARVDEQDRALLWTEGGGMQELPSFGVESNAAGINNAGVIVGAGALQYGDVRSWRAAIWQDGQVKDLNSLLMPGFPVPFSYASAINEQGQILAAYDSYLSPPIPEPATAVLLAAAAFVLTRRRDKR